VPFINGPVTDAAGPAFSSGLSTINLMSLFFTERGEPITLRGFPEGEATVFQPGIKGSKEKSDRERSVTPEKVPSREKGTSTCSQIGSNIILHSWGIEDANGCERGT